MLTIIIRITMPVLLNPTQNDITDYNNRQK